MPKQVYLDTSPPSPGDAPVSQPLNPAPSSFFHGTGIGSYPDTTLAGPNDAPIDTSIQDPKSSFYAGSGVATASQPPLQAVANRGMIYNHTRVATADNLKCGESRVHMKIGGADVSELRFVFAGFYILNDDGTETLPGNDQIIEIAVEWPGIGTRRVLFGGKTVGTIPNGAATYISDPIFPIEFGLTKFPKNADFWYRCRRQVGLNEIHTTHGISSGDGESTKYSDGTSASQLLNTGELIRPPGGADAAADMGPCAVIGRPIGTPDLAILFVGDSILDGSNDDSIDGDGSEGGGWAARGLWNVNGRSVPFTKMTCGGTTAFKFVLGFSRRAEYFQWHTHAVCNYGTNDMWLLKRTPAQVMENLKTIWQALKTAGLRYVSQTVCIPRTSSTDSWATVANQTPVAGFETGGIARDVLNNSIVAEVGADGLDACFDYNSFCADAVALDRWKANGTAQFYTLDGTHPNPNIHTDVGAFFASKVATWS